MRVFIVGLLPSHIESENQMHSKFPPEIHRACIPLAATFLCLAEPCFALKPDFYSPFHNSKGYDKLSDIVASADRVLKCKNIDEIDIGIGSSVELKELPRNVEPGVALDFTNETSKPRILKRSVVFFKGSEIETFLRNEKHKDLLVVKVIDWFNREDKPGFLKQINLLLDKLGYRRILILGTNPHGIYVVQDSQERNASKQFDTSQSTN